MATFKSVVTTLGQARIAAAVQSGKDINIIEMAVGDGGGKATQPSAAQTRLVKEVYRTKLNSLKLDAKNANWIIAEAIISASVGGFWMREMGLYADDGALIAVCNMADTYKPTLEEGSGRTQTLRMVITVTDTSAVTLTLDDSLIVATEEYVNDLLAAHEKSRNHPDGTLTEKGFLQLSSSTNSTSETLAATPKAVKAANDNANGRLPSDGTAVAANKLSTARKIAGVEFDGTKDISLTPENVGALPSGGTAAAATKLATARKIAGVAFDGTKDIAITSGDVGAVQQGGGVGMTTNKVILGWDGTKLRAQVDSTAMGALYCEYNKPTAQDTGALPVTGGNVAYVNDASHYASKPGVWEGAGSFGSQYSNALAPFIIPYGFIAPKGTGSYAPIVKGVIQTNTYGYGTAVSFGALTSGEANFASAVIHVIGDSGKSGLWQFDPNNGSFGCPGAIYSSGNVNCLGLYNTFINTGRLWANSQANPGAGQGTHIGWNESNSQGESNFLNNKGGGSGGFSFRTVNVSNTVESGYVRFSGTGDITSRGNYNTDAGMIYEQGRRVYSPNNKPSPADIGAIQKDGCSFAGFVAGNGGDPYMRYEPSNTVVQLAPRDWVNGNFVSRNVGSVGSLAFARINTQNRSTGFGELISGGELSPASVTGYAGTGGGNWAALNAAGSLAGTWQSLGYCVSDTEGGNRHWGISLFMRIS